MGSIKEIGKNLGGLVKTQAAGLTMDLLLGDYRGAAGRIKETPTNVKSIFNELNPQAVHQYEATLLIDQKGQRTLQFADYQDLKDFDLKFYLYNNPQMRRFLFGPFISSLINPLFEDNRDYRDRARFQHACNKDFVDVVFSLKDGQTMFVPLPHGKDPQDGWAMARVTKKGNKALIQTHLSPSMSDEELKKTFETLKVQTTGQQITFGDGNNNSPFYTAIVTDEPYFDFVQRPEDFRRWLSGVLGQGIWQRSIPTCQNCQVNSQPRAGENSTLTHAQVERARDHVPLTQRLYPPPEPLLRPPVLMFRNIGTRVENQSSLVFGAGKRNKEIQQEVPVQEVPIEAAFSRPEPLSIFPSRRELAISQIASIIEKSSEKPGRETQAGISQIVKGKQVVVELPVRIIETQSSILTVENPAQEQARVEEQAVSPVSERQPQVKKENKTVSLEKVMVGPERAIAQEVVVKEETVEETITIPLIEIAAATPVIYSRREKRAERVWLQRSKGVERVYTVGVELEPVRVADQSVVIKTAAGVAMELVKEPGTKTSEIATSILWSVGNNLQSQPPKNQDRGVKVQPQDLILSVEKREELVTPVVENAGGEEKVEEQGEPRILTVRRFSFNSENNKPEPEIEKLEIKKLVLVMNPTQDSRQPAILELELPKDQNARLYAFWHFLRRVIKEEFGEDILWSRRISMVRADEPVETIKEIEYYLEVLRGTHAQVFAFIN